MWPDVGRFSSDELLRIVVEQIHWLICLAIAGVLRLLVLLSFGVVSFWQ